MKFVFTFVVLVCSNLYFCQAENASANQDSNKPSAHIEAANKGEVTYNSNTVIKDFSTSAPYSHLAGGMTYADGKLTVPIPGRYYIYAQVYHHNPGRVNVKVNNQIVTMIQPPTKGTDNGALYAGGVFNLEADDVITLTVDTYPIAYAKIYMYTYHSYFGAYMI